MRLSGARSLNGDKGFDAMIDTCDRPAQTSSEHAFLAGGGEMGSLMRAFDWSRSTIGAPETWGEPLRIVTRLMLNTGHPMFVFWGNDGACLYNDAYRQSIGSERHPTALGQPARQVWEEIWDVIGPQIEQVLAGGSATWHENQLLPITRHGQREDVYWTYSYSPIGDDTALSGVGGVLVVCTETTKHVLAERRLIDQSERQRRLFDQAPGFIAVLTGRDHVFEFANAAYKRLTHRTDLVGRTVRDVFPELTGQGFFEYLDQVFETGEPFVAAHIPIKLECGLSEGSNELFLDFINAPIFSEIGEVVGIFVQGHDVTHSHLAATVQNRQERHLRLLIDELNHRVRNTLAIVQGLAQQTFSGDSASPSARAAFEGRLLALASAHNLLTQETWVAADLNDVVVGAFDAHSTSSDRYTANGPRVSLEPKTAVMMALALHELTTNATKYGSLSTDEGHVVLSWSAKPDDPARFIIRWEECGGPLVSPPEQRGFGSKLIERALAAELRGHVDLSFPPTGVVCEIVARLGADDTTDVTCAGEFRLKH